MAIVSISQNNLLDLNAIEAWTVRNPSLGLQAQMFLSALQVCTVAGSVLRGGLVCTLYLGEALKGLISYPALFENL